MNEPGSPSALPSRLRLDLFLKWSGLIRRRTLAKWLCERGAILVNQQEAKAGRPVGTGDHITIHQGTHTVVVEILALPPHLLPHKAGKKGSFPAVACYRVVSEMIREDRRDS